MSPLSTSFHPKSGVTRFLPLFVFFFFAIIIVIQTSQKSSSSSATNTHSQYSHSQSCESLKTWNQQLERVHPIQKPECKTRRLLLILYISFYSLSRNNFDSLIIILLISTLFSSIGFWSFINPISLIASVPFRRVPFVTSPQEQRYILFQLPSCHNLINSTWFGYLLHLLSFWVSLSFGLCYPQ